ncbi:hypothetical protein LCGC14_1421280 [marine sediment metagenome]|uniref:Uncharacterized protein n=1 Tax=marine sediment metagenome TaxID=412755 RepID=A0A0F9M6V3_9ZZZZ
MADVTFTNSSGTVFTFAQGEINVVRSQISPDVEQSALPGTGPISAFLFDFNGPIKIITITGQLFVTTASRTDTGSTTTILEQKQWLEQNINGFQLPTAFSSTYEGQTYDGSSYQSTTVAVGNISFDEEAGNPEELKFTMQFVVGS